MKKTLQKDQQSMIKEYKVRLIQWLLGFTYWYSQERTLKELNDTNYTVDNGSDLITLVNFYAMRHADIPELPWHTNLI